VAHFDSSEAQQLLLMNPTELLPPALVLEAAAVVEAAYRRDSRVCLVKDKAIFGRHRHLARETPLSRLVVFVVVTPELCQEAN